MVAMATPAEITIAKGGQNFPPDNTSGRKPIIVVTVVARIWRVRLNTIAESTSTVGAWKVERVDVNSPSPACSGSVSSWIPAKTTIESLIAMPTNPMVPTMAMKPKGYPKQNSANGPNPITRPATEAMIKAERNEPSTATSVTIISEMISVRFAAKVLIAAERFSSSPPISIRVLPPICKSEFSINEFSIIDSMSANTSAGSTPACR